jgi:hypothetical protein
MQILSFLALGSDSLLCGLAIGSFTRGRRRRLLLAASFGLCDGAATITGRWLGLHNSLPVVPVLAAYLALVWLMSAASWRARDKMFILPIVLSIDNLLWSDPRGAAMPIALSSALLAWCGLSFAFVVREVFSSGNPKIRARLQER